ncbi:MAG: hypothetical protein HRT69_12825 [Flavobacteriaceae bacterium]|nr:hypothetical protein [Flavobacteriaceae bacterium]
MIEFKEGKVFIDNQEFKNPEILGQLILSMAKEENMILKLINPKEAA